MNSTAAPTAVATPRIERPREGRILAGVSAGLARHLNVDPVLVRLAFVVATVAGGFGVLAYVAGLLFIPEEGARRPIVHAGSLRNAGTVTGVALLVVGGLMALDTIFDSDALGHSLGAVAFLGAGAWLLLRTPRDTAPVTGRDTTATTVSGASPATPRPSRRGTRVVAGLMLLVAGGVTALGAAGVALGWQEGVAIAVMAAGAVLVAGSFIGASPWLVVPPLVVAAAVGSMGAAGATFDGPIGERAYAPGAASDLRDRYAMSIGDLEVDLRGLRLVPGTTTELDVHLGIGEARVLLPDDVTVRIDGRAGAGEVTLPGGTSDGTDVDRAETLTASAGAPVLVLDADVGLGDLTVERAGGR